MSPLSSYQQPQPKRKNNNNNNNNKQRFKRRYKVHFYFPAALDRVFSFRWRRSKAHTVNNKHNNMNDGARVRANDPSMGKLYLTQPPSQYFRHDSNDNENGNDHNDDDDDFQVFLKALRQNTHIHYVLLERHFVHQLIRHDERRREQQTQEQESSSCCSQPKTQGQEEEDTPLHRLKYPAVLHGLAHIPHLTQLELLAFPFPLQRFAQPCRPRADWFDSDWAW